MAQDGEDVDAFRWKDGRGWRLGSQSEVGWIVDGTGVGLTITAAIPPVFEAYATILVPEPGEERTAHEQAMLDFLDSRSAEGGWWLGYLDTGADEVVFPDAPKVMLYAGWFYVLVNAGSRQALNWRSSSSWRGRLPDLIFPGDRAWLLSWLWDDDWRCIGGPSALIDGLTLDDRLQVRRVALGDVATPPGYQAR
jgi:hypothetical protein